MKMKTKKRQYHEILKNRPINIRNLLEIVDNGYFAAIKEWELVLEKYEKLKKEIHRFQYHKAEPEEIRYVERIISRLLDSDKNLLLYFLKEVSILKESFFKSQTTIAEETAYVRETVNRSIRRLIKFDLIRKRNIHGFSVTHNYFITSNGLRILAWFCFEEKIKTE